MLAENLARPLWIVVQIPSRDFRLEFPETFRFFGDERSKVHRFDQPMIGPEWRAGLRRTR